MLLVLVVRWRRVLPSKCCCGHQKSVLELSSDCSGMLFFLVPARARVLSCVGRGGLSLFLVLCGARLPRLGLGGFPRPRRDAASLLLCRRAGALAWRWCFLCRAVWALASSPVSRLSWPLPSFASVGVTGSRYLVVGQLAEAFFFHLSRNRAKTCPWETAFCSFIRKSFLGQKSMVWRNAEGGAKSRKQEAGHSDGAHNAQ